MHVPGQEGNMVQKKQLSRREFLRLSAFYAAGVVLTACAPSAATSAPTSLEDISTASESTPIVAKEQPLYPEISNLALKESPGIFEWAKIQPNLINRLPDNPLILYPVDGNGTFGGRLQMLIPGWPGYFSECLYGHSPLRWVDDGLSIATGICDNWSVNEDNSKWTFHIRNGLKWSDGQPCTAEDVVFWWEELTVRNNPSYPDPIPDFGFDANGTLADMYQVDDYTLVIEYATPAPLTAKRLAMWVNANIGPRWIAPKHYLTQFHPSYNSGITDFNLFYEKSDLSKNPEMPSLNAWIVTKYEEGYSLTAERNPYYYAVDSEGNQLPYIDGIDCVFIQDQQSQLAQIRQGLVDFAPFIYYTLGDYETLVDNSKSGGCEVYLLDSGSGTGMMYFWNYDAEDDRIRNLFRDPRFKQAMSYALDRPRIQKEVYYDTGFVTTGTLSPKAFEFNFNAEAQEFFTYARDIYANYDPEKARVLLNEIGVVDVDGDGWRTFADGAYLEIRIDIASYASDEAWKVLDIAKSNWEDVGLLININQTDDLSGLWQSGRGRLRTDMEVGDGPDHLVYPSWLIPNDPDHWAPLCGRLFQYANSETEYSESDLWPWDRNPPRFNRSEEYYSGTPIENLHDLYRQAITEVDEIKRAQIVWEMWKIHMYDGPFFIGTVANYPRMFVKSEKITNIPTQDQHKLGGFVNPWIIPYPAITNPETYSCKADQMVTTDLPQVYPLSLGQQWNLIYNSQNFLSTAVLVQIEEPTQTLDLQTKTFDTELLSDKYTPVNYKLLRAVTNFDVIDTSTGSVVKNFTEPMIVVASYTKEDVDTAGGSKDNLVLMIFDANQGWLPQSTEITGTDEGGTGKISISSWDSHICWGSR